MSDRNSPSVDETRLEQLEAAWLEGQPKRIEDCLPDVNDPRYLATLEELVRIDLEFSWKKPHCHNATTVSTRDETLSKPPVLEDYLSRFQELNKPEIVLRLLQEEYLVRHKHGDRPDADELADRFPAVVRSTNQIEESLPDTLKHQQPHGEGPGSKIGPYKLLQKIGEGGFGVVYLADQEQPVRRRVALKIIKAGMDTREVIARFEAERQALAMMEHTNIARVLDAGTTASCRPYFVMELVKGIPITEYCDKNKLDVRQRLELYIPVCHAVQHAHQKGVIHRDIKPSNVLVTLFDGRPVPKIIDFGVAKATQQRLTERTMFTQYGQMIGTPQYMSPEQAEMNALDVDTRSDIYSLGVLLYELLTGTTPIEAEVFRKSAFDEVLRLIREGEPPRPSTRLSQTGEALATISSQRQCEPKKLGFLLKGDLDWIVMKALEKDRTRRYETATGLALDVRRHLDCEPVEASPPSTVYRLRKFARKHRNLLATAGTIASILIVATILSIWLARRAVSNREIAEAANKRLETAVKKLGAANKDLRATKADLEVALDDAEQQTREAQLARNAEAGERARAEQALRDAETARNSEAAQRKAAERERGRALAAEKQAEEKQRLAEERQREAEDLRSKEAAQRETAERLAEEKERLLLRAQENLRMAAKAVNDYLTKVGNAPQLKARGLHELRKSLLTGAAEFYGQLVEQNPEDPEIKVQCGYAYRRLSRVWRDSHDNSKALEFATRAMMIFEDLRADDSDNPGYQHELATSTRSVAQLHATLRQMDQATQEYDAAKQLLKQLSSVYPDNPNYAYDTAIIHNDVAHINSTLGRIQEAQIGYLAALEIYEKLRLEQPASAVYIRDQITSYSNLGDLYRKAYRTSDAKDAYSKAIELSRRLSQRYFNFPDYQIRLADSHVSMARLHGDLFRVEEADTQYQLALEQMNRLHSKYPNNANYANRYANIRLALANLHRENGPYQRVQEHFQKAIDIYGQLVDRHPFDPLYRQHLAIGYYHLASFLHYNRSSDKAEKQYRDAISNFEFLVRRYPNYDNYKEWLAASYEALGKHFEDIKDVEQAKETFSKALLPRRKLANKNPNLPEQIAPVARLLGKLRRYPEAESEYRKALKLYEKRVDEQPEVPRNQAFVSGTIAALGQLHIDQQQWEFAKDSYDRALSIRRRLIDEFPDRPSLRAVVAAAHAKLSEVYSNTSRFDEAIDALTAAVQRYQELVDDYPQILVYRKQLAATRGSLAEAYENVKRSEKVEETFLAATVDFHELARAYEDKSRFYLAEKAYNDAVEMLRQANTRYPRSTKYAERLAATYELLGELYYYHQLDQDAEVVWNRELELRMQLGNDQTDSDDHQYELSKTHSRIGKLCDLQKKRSAALRHYQSALRMLETIVSKREWVPKYRYELADCQRRLGWLLATDGKVELGIEKLKMSIDVCLKLIEDDPDAGKYREMLGICQQDLAWLRAISGQRTQARNTARAAAETYLRAGSLYEHQNLPKDAETVYLSVVKVLTSLIDQDADWVECAPRLADGYRGLARVRFTLQKGDEEIDALMEEERVRKKLVQELPEATEHQIALAEYYQYLGSLLLRVESFESAVDVFDKSLDILRKLPAQERDSAANQLRVAELYRYRAQAFRDLENLERAQQDYEQSVDRLESMKNERDADLNLRLTETRRELALVLIKREHFDEGEALLKSALEVAQRLADDDPKQPKYQIRIAQCNYSLADVFEETNRLDEAALKLLAVIECYQRIQKETADDDYLPDQATAFWRMGKFHQNRGDLRGAIEFYGKEIDALRQFSKSHPGDTTRIKYLHYALDRRARAFRELEEFDRAIADWEAAGKVATRWGGHLYRVERGITFVLKGNAQAGKAAAQEVLDMTRNSGFALYLAARICAVAAAVALDDESLGEKERAAQADKDAGAAMYYLRWAESSGYFDTKANLEQLMTNDEFDLLRNRTDFKALVRKVTESAPASP